MCAASILVGTESLPHASLDQSEQDSWLVSGARYVPQSDHATSDTPLPHWQCRPRRQETEELVLRAHVAAPPSSSNSTHQCSYPRMSELPTSAAHRVLRCLKCRAAQLHTITIHYDSAPSPPHHTSSSQRNAARIIIEPI